jgi:general secretion pathway protein H
VIEPDLQEAAGAVPNQASRLRGFTLLELLVVILILALAAGMVSLSVAPSEDRLLAMEIDRLAALFRLAQDEARTGGRPLVWRADTAGYRFVIGETEKERKADDPLRPRSWPFAVANIDAPALIFGAEPLLQPAQIRIATTRGELVLMLDAFGNLRRTQ